MSDARSQIPEYHNVLVVGIGMAGISMGCHLKLMLGETDVRFFEREEELGGTWGSMNKYPGAGCDIPIPLYSFSFAQKKDWTTFFALHDEINTYQRAVCDKFDLTRKIHFKTEVVNAHWDKDLNLWHVFTRPAKGRSDNDKESETKHWVCKVFVTAVGGLSQPNECTIPGHETFKGPLFHSARWDRSISMAGKNVICVGNGCSATQFIPIIAKEAKQVTQFVRSKHWYAQRPANPVDFVVWRWLVRYIPGFASLQRLVIYFVLELSMVMMKNTYIGTWYRNKFANDCRNYIRKTAPSKYHDILIPKGKELIPGCKRRVFDTDYLPSLRRDNVELETDPLVEIKEHSVVTKSGKELKADVIVMANGFNVTRMGFPMLVYGESGKTMQEYWEKKGGPQVYRGCMLSDFPNFFSLMGPNTGTGHFSYVHTAEHSAQFAIRVMTPILRSPRPQILTLKEKSQAPKGAVIKNPKVQVKYNKEEDEQVWIQSKSQEMVYSQNCGSWYVDPKSQRVIAVYPDFQYKFAHRATYPQYQDFNYSNLPGGKSIYQTLPYLTRIRTSLGIGGLPNVTDQQRKAFRTGAYAVGNGNSYFDKPGRD